MVLCWLKSLKVPLSHWEHFNSEQQEALCTPLPALQQLLPSLEWSLREIVERKHTRWLRTETIRWKFLAWVEQSRQHDQNDPFCMQNFGPKSRFYYSSFMFTEWTFVFKIILFCFLFKCGTTEYNGSYSEFNSGQLIYSTLVEGRIFRCLVQQT